MSLIQSLPSMDRKADPKHLFFFLVLLLLIFFMAARTPVDTDLWWHLRAGQETIQTGHVTLTDNLSFTRSGSVWYNHSWLAQVVLYLVYNFGGFIGLALLVDVLVVVGIAFTWLQLTGPSLVKMGIIILVALVASWVWSPRPQLFSLMLFAITGTIIYQLKYQHKDRIWLLIPIFILWSNLHAGYTLGLILIGAMLAGELINHLPGYPSEKILPWKSIIKLSSVGLLCGLAVAINPNGTQTWLEPFRTVQVQALQQNIAEWASPDFHEFGQQTLLWLLFLCIAAIGLSGKKIDGVDLVTLILFGYLVMLARRNYGPFALAAGPILSRHLWPAIEGMWLRAREQHPSIANTFSELTNQINQGGKISSRLQKTINLSVASLIFAAGLFRLYLVACPPIVSAFTTKSYPVGAVQWIQQQQPAGQMLNSYNWGGYLVWNLRGYPVFLDGRTDLYNDEIIGEWVRVIQANSGWQQVLDRWNIRLILLEPTQPVVQQLAQNGWQLSYQDQVSVVYTR